MVRLVSLGVVLGFAFAATLALTPARAGDFWGCSDTAYWCTRDAIYAQFKLIAGLEADPDIDEGVKGPLITAARAEIHRLRATISEPPPHAWATIGAPLPERPAPCCYTRKSLYLR
jgi:hypothetical protein